jgi:hypothetical protein
VLTSNPKLVPAVVEAVVECLGPVLGLDQAAAVAKAAMTDADVRMRTNFFTWGSRNLSGLSTFATIANTDLE